MDDDELDELIDKTFTASNSGVSQSRMQSIVSQLHFNPHTSEYSHPDSQVKVTKQFVYQCISENVLLGAMGLTIGNNGQLRAATPVSSTKKLIRPAHLVDATVIQFRTKKRYHYVAIWIQATQRWYITGRGEWYGTNELTLGQMNEVLARDEVDALVTVSGWSNNSPLFT